MTGTITKNEFRLREAIKEALTKAIEGEFITLEQAQDITRSIHYIFTHTTQKVSHEQSPSLTDYIDAVNKRIDE